jgi:hypothetical protein
MRYHPSLKTFFKKVSKSILIDDLALKHFSNIPFSRKQIRYALSRRTRLFWI